MSANPKQHLSLLISSTALAAFSLASIVNFTDPQTSSWVTLGFFYTSLFLLNLGLFTLLGLGLRQWLWPGLYIINLSNSFRQAVLVSILITGSFWLLSEKLLFWWVEASLVLFLASVEAFLSLKI
jgi:hypothetical protein